MVECLRYAADLMCRIFEIIPIVGGSVLFSLSSVQMYIELIAVRNLHFVGKITKDIHHIVFICSPTYMIGWLFNTMMSNPKNLLFADVCIDAVTISLAYILWIIAHEKVGLWYFALTGTIPKRPRRMIDVLLLISIAWVIVNNSINYKIDRLWPRAFFYFYLSFIFAFGIFLLTGLVVTLAIQTQSLPDRWLGALVILILIVGLSAITSQILDGLNHLRDRDTAFYAQLPEDAITFSLIFMSTQGVMLFAGVSYSWMKPLRDHAEYQAV